MVNHAGSWGIGDCLSFYPAKVVGCLEDGGALLTNNDELANLQNLQRSWTWRSI